MVNVAVTGGDGIGPEVARAGMRTMEAAAEADSSIGLHFTEFMWGCEYYR
jgi:tartrate dehydrogenase/decarboxylase / D-malate dehydrogenase